MLRKRKKAYAYIVLVAMIFSIIPPMVFTEEVNAGDSQASEIILDSDKLNLVVNATKTVAATVYDQSGNTINNQSIEWISGNSEVAGVNEEGLVTAYKTGETTVTAAVYGHDGYIKVACPVNVQEGYSTNLVIISGTSGFTAPMVEAYKNLTEKSKITYQFGLKVFSPADLDTEEGQAKIRKTLSNADAVLLEMLGANRDKALHDIFKYCQENDWKDKKQPEIFVQRSGEKNDDGKWADKGLIIEIVRNLDVKINKNDDEWQRLNDYLVNSGIKNWERLLLYLASTYGGVKIAGEKLDPIKYDGIFVYHPAADSSSESYEEKSVSDESGLFFNSADYFAWYENRPNYDKDAPWVGIMGYDSSYKNADQEMMLAILEAVEKKGLNAILLYPPSKEREEGAREFYYRDGKPIIDVLICSIGFNFVRNKEEKGVEFFKELNVPVLSPIYSSDLKKWYDDPAGAMDGVYWQVAMPELEGRIEPIMMGGTVTKDVDEATGAVVTKKEALPDRIDRLAERVLSWVKLRWAANEDKKVAVLYYNMQGGKDGIGASYLNVPASLTEVLRAMKDAGYKVDDDKKLSENGQISEDKVFDAMFTKGRNIGGWAPGELEKFAGQEGIITVDVDTYLQWYEQLPQKLQDKVEADWGPAPGKVMVYNGEIIIPGVISGNIFFGPQPMRGWGEDIDKIIHSPDLPPSHQYLAFYFWLEKEFEANAVVHLGTHGTAEWLPGKSLGLSSEDWPDIVHGNMPNIYPYIVNNPGEATQAKRRGNAVIIDHLTAAVANTDLYGNLLELHDLAHKYEDVIDPKNERPAKEVEILQEKIMDILKGEGVAEQMGLDVEKASFEEMLEAAHEYLHSLENEVTPLGLHTFGLPPQGERFDAMVEAIINYDPENRKEIADKIKENLQKTTEEMYMLLKALGAGYIPPGLGKDPVKDPEIMPTGRNIKTFDPRTVPDKLAWKIGKQLSDDLLKIYYEEHGRYPESIGVILWAIETMRTDGQSIAMVMNLLGIEPVWDKSGKVKSYEIVPTKDLNHPRIDVVVSMSGLFRDTFSVVSELLDKAVRDLAKLDEEPEHNYVKKHYESLKETFIKQGKSEEEADFLASSRIFSQKPGTYGAGLSEKMDATSTWDSSEDLVDTYLSRMSYIYGSPTVNGEPVYGVEGREAFEQVLKNIDAVVQVRDSIYGTLDNDDVAQYLGGMVLASKWASGKDIDAYIANTRLGADRAKIQTLKQFVAQELHSRLLNPKFINEMLKEGYSGSETIAKWIGNTFFMDATTGAIGDWAWRDIANKYVFDENVRSKLDPYALQSLIAYTTEANRKGFWDASSEELQKLSNVYMQSMVDYGVVCCHHTCNNIVFNEWLAQYSTLDNNVRKQFEQTLAEATQKEVNIPSKVDQSKKSSKSSKSRKSKQNTQPIEEPIKETIKEPIEEPVKEPKAVETMKPSIPEEIQEEPTDVTMAPDTVVPTVEQQNQPATAGDKEIETPSTKAVASAGPKPAPEIKGEKPEQDAPKKEVKAYELKKKEEKPMSTGTKAVSAIAIVGALALVAIFFKGYWSKRF